MSIVEKCPFCGETLYNVEYITNEIKNFDHYQIRNIDKYGCGSFFYFRVPAGSPSVEIEKECLSVILQEVGRDQKRMEDNRFSVLPAVSLFSDRMMDVVEMDFGPYGLTTKRGGNKFAVDRHGHFKIKKRKNRGLQNIQSMQKEVQMNNYNFRGKVKYNGNHFHFVEWVEGFYWK